MDDDIYNKGNINWWLILDKKVLDYAKNNGFMYVIDEEPFLKKYDWETNYYKLFLL